MAGVGTAGGIDRRTLLLGGLGGAAALAGASGLAGCSSSPQESASGNTGVALPTYTRFTGVTPDLPGDGRVLDGFLRYPADPVASTDGAPGDGKPVSFMTNIPGAVPPTADRNSFWQAINTAIGSPLEITMASNDEYPAKFATQVAGGDLPDVINIPAGAPDLPRMLRALCTELTEHLSGDAITDYPNLANIPQEAWRGCVYDGAIFAIPVPRLMARVSLPLYRADLLSKQGIDDPVINGFDDLLTMAQQLTAPKSRRWAWSRSPLPYVKQMLGVPNNWSESGGTFTTAYADERVPDALEATRKIFAAGVVQPDATASSASVRKQWFMAGTVAFDLDSFVAWNQYYTDALAGNGVPDDYRVGMLDVPAFDGGAAQGKPWTGAANNNITAFSQQTGHELTTLLKIANWLAAPFGSSEYLTRKYGVEGTHYRLDGSDPVLTGAGASESGIGLQYYADAPMTLYYPKRPDVPKAQHAVQAAIVDRLVSDPAYGLYSRTASRDQAQLATKLTDVETQILLGRTPVSDWAKAVQDWRDDGGDTIKSEYEQAFAEAAGG